MAPPWHLGPPRARCEEAVIDVAALSDLDAGACSELEHGYLTGVGRAHGLGPARRQVLDRPCWTAACLAELLRVRGWRGVARAGAADRCHLVTPIRHSGPAIGVRAAT